MKYCPNIFWTGFRIQGTCLRDVNEKRCQFGSVNKSRGIEFRDTINAALTPTELQNEIQIVHSML